ncbi:Glycine betaine transporter BetP [Microbacterium sp. SA39]|nr:Glycine betaine transporter BetP [Microbacterium sp. SA39]
MLFVGFSRYGRIPLGRDDEEPEFSMFSWISMLFAAGMGIGLVFWGAAEPLTFFETPPPGTVQANTLEAMHTAQAQVLYHWGPQAWAFYALVGAAIAYGAFRRGRTPLKGTTGPLGRTIDIFSIIVTLFGTAASLSLGALQIGHGVEIVTGIGELGARRSRLSSRFLTRSFTLRIRIRKLYNILYRLWRSCDGCDLGLGCAGGPLAHHRIVSRGIR